MEKTLEYNDLDLLQRVLGSQNKNAKIIEKYLDVVIEPNKEGLRIISENKHDLDLAAKLIEKLTSLAESGLDINQNISKYLSEASTKKLYTKQELAHFNPETITLNSKGQQVKPKTIGQARYIDKIKDNIVTFAIGPAGTGKTYLAVAMAVQAFREEKVDRIILTRPAVESGEQLGFLPGDLQNKVDPYMRPLYDALADLMGIETYRDYIERGLIEISPLAYMRGRTLDNSFIILDEAQNTTPSQMKMFLTRIGFDSKVVVTGDITQIDLKQNQKSGLKDAVEVLDKVKDISFAYLDTSDVVRNRVVQSIIRAYERRDSHRRKH